MIDAYNSFGNQRNYSEYGKTKINAQIQDTIKIEEQAYSNEILCRMLSTAECYYNRLMNIKNVKELFGYYNALNSGNRKDNEKLKKQFLHQIELFKSSMEDYYNNYEKYDFPNNLPQSRIKDIIENWKIQLENQENSEIKSEAKYYDGILDLINGHYNKVSYRNEIRTLNQNKVNKDGEVAKQLAKNLPYVQEKAENLRKKVREAALRGDTNINVILNGDYTQDEDLIKGKKHFDKLEKNTEFNNAFDNNQSNNTNNYGDSEMLIDDDEQKNTHNNNINENKMMEEKKNEILNTIFYIKMKSEYYLYITENITLKFMNSIPPNLNENELIVEINDLIVKFKQLSEEFLSKFGKCKEIQNEISETNSYIIRNINGTKGNIPIMRSLYNCLSHYIYQF